MTVRYKSTADRRRPGCPASNGYHRRKARATFVRLIQGSGTVAMLTAASMGAFVFSYFNDSFYWVVNRLQGI